MWTLRTRFDRLVLACLSIYVLGSAPVLWTALANNWHGDVWQLEGLVDILVVAGLTLLAHYGLPASGQRQVIVLGLVIATVGFIGRFLSGTFYDHWYGLAWIGVSISILSTWHLKIYRVYIIAIVAVIAGYALLSFQSFALPMVVVWLVLAAGAIVLVSLDPRLAFDQATQRAVLVALGALVISVILLRAASSTTLLTISFVALAIAKLSGVVAMMLHYREMRAISEPKQVLCHNCKAITSDASPYCGKCGADRLAAYGGARD